MFEYRLVEPKLFDLIDRNAEARLNDLGRDGWEMVGTCGVHGQTFVFKRPLAPGKPRAKPATRS